MELDVQGIGKGCGRKGMWKERDVEGKGCGREGMWKGREGGCNFIL